MLCCLRTSGTEWRLNFKNIAVIKLNKTKYSEKLMDGALGGCTTRCGGPWAKCSPALLELMTRTSRKPHIPYPQDL